MKKPLIIIGAGNVGAYLAYNISDFPEYEIIGLLDDDSKKQGNDLYGYAVLGGIEHLSKLVDEHSELNVAICIHAPTIKRIVAKKIADLDVIYPTFISPQAWVSKKVPVGKGCIIYPGVSINYESVLGDFVIMNMNCAIGHNATVGHFSSFAPGVNLGGFTVLEEAVDMGIGSATKQNIQIGKESIIGGQSMLTKNIPAHSIAVGVPAKVVKQ